MADETLKMIDDVVIDKLSEHIASSDDNQEKVVDLLKKQQSKQIKEKVRETKNETIVKDSGEEVGKEMGALRKVFNESFSSMKDAFSPGGLLKSFGLLTGSPLFMLIGDKFDDLISKYKEFSVEQKRRSATEFMAEQRREEEMALSKQQVELLKDIKEKEFEFTEKDSLLDLVKKPFAALSKFLPGALGGALGGGAIGKLLPNLFKGAGGLLKGGGRLLGKAALPIALLTGGFDFAEGFGDVLEFTDKDDLASRLQAGISNTISGFTFGLLDKKTIFNSIDLLKDKLTDIFMTPLNLIKDIASGKNILSSISKVVSSFTFGLLPTARIEKVITNLTDYATEAFRRPIEAIKGIISGENLINNLSKLLSSMTLGIFSEESISQPINMLINTVENVYDNVVSNIKSKFSELAPKLVGGLIKKMSQLTFGILSPEEISKGIENITDRMASLIFDTIMPLKDAIMSFDITSVFDKIENTFNDIKTHVTDFADMITEKFESLLDIILNPFESVTNFFSNLKSSFDFGLDFDPTQTKSEAPNPTRKTFSIDDDRLIPSHNSSITMEKLTTERIKEIRNEREREIADKNRAASAMEKAQNTIFNSTTQNLVVNDDMRTKTDDTEWMRPSHF